MGESVVSILDEVAAHVEARPNTCTVHAWLLANPKYTAGELAEAAKVHSKAAVWRFMQSKGYTSGASSVERHMAGHCKCL
jgi:DNA-binding MurR/RpiR family transcriptional regulator